MWQALIPLITGVIDRVVPDEKAAQEAKLRALEMAQKGQLAELDAELQGRLAQIEVNKADAAGSPMQRNWRPAVGWVCAAALAWDTIGKPIGLFVWVSLGHPAPVIPNLSTEQLYGLLFGLLGLGGLRSVEKVKGVA